jgi:hypothetical protein
VERRPAFSSTPGVYGRLFTERSPALKKMPGFIQGTFAVERQASCGEAARPLEWPGHPNENFQFAMRQADLSA